MTPWPWITALVAVLLIANPLGYEVFHSAFLSGEALARNIWRPIFLAGVASLVVLMAIEWGIRARLARHRAAAGAKTES
jgi:hypothetical protein